MTRQRFVGLCVALAHRCRVGYDGQHADGDVLRFYRDKRISNDARNNLKCRSYAEAWESFLPVRKAVGM